ncbi:hypothetical protein Tco_1162215 [Tanacetum coccineum]
MASHDLSSQPVSTKFVSGLVACQVSCRVGPSSDLDIGSCTRAREVMMFCTIKSKPLALPWGRTPRLDSGVREDVIYKGSSCMSNDLDSSSRYQEFSSLVKENVSQYSNRHVQVRAKEEEYHNWEGRY